jgi:indole-3-glycerol phosphate synthase
VLKTIIETKREELKTFVQPEPILKRSKQSLREALLHPHRSIGLIAEVKKASPSKGTFCSHLDPVDVAKRYEASGADAISVLTDRTYFKGDREYLKGIKAAVDIPILRKDFIIDSRQIEESKRIGADAILLIVAALAPKKLYELYKEAKAMDIECLVEVHNREELDELLNVFQPQIIGINNRNLNTFETTIQTTINMLPHLPPGSVVVSESGFKHFTDLAKILDYGVDGILVGEALMTAETPEKGIQRLFNGESL